MKKDFKHKLSAVNIIDSLPDCILILDETLCIENINDSAENMLGTSRNQAVGRSAAEILPEEIKKALSEKRTVFGDEITATFKGGIKHPVQPNASPLYSSTGEVLGLVLQIRDLQAAWLLNQKELQKTSTSSLEGLVLGLAHELNNPLSGIRGAAQILSKSADSQESRNCAEIIVKETDRLTELLGTLKTFEPYSKENFESFDINGLLREIEYLQSRSEAGQPIEFKLNFDVTLPEIWGSRNSLKQALLNLINNAVQALDGRGTIEIITRWVSEYKLDGNNVISVSIIDDGPGIPKINLANIFKPFFTTRPKGSGLGLFIAYQIVAKHGGVIIVDSDEGQGARFDVYLPIVKAQ